MARKNTRLFARNGMAIRIQQAFACDQPNLDERNPYCGRERLGHVIAGAFLAI